MGALRERWSPTAGIRIRAAAMQSSPGGSLDVVSGLEPEAVKAVVTLNGTGVKSLTNTRMGCQISSLKAAFN